MYKFSSRVWLGFLLVLCIFMNGCVSKPVENPVENYGAELETEPVDILEAANIAESVPVGESEDEPKEKEIPPLETVEEETSPALPMEVYFAEGHGDEGLGIRLDPDSEVEEYSLGNITDSQGYDWGFRTGNGAALSVVDENNSGDSYARFDLANEIVFENTSGTEIQIEVLYLDIGQDNFCLEYDAIQDGEEFLKSTEFIQKLDSGELKTATFLLNDAYFGNRLSGGDFQINDLGDGSEIFIKVTVRVSSGVNPQIPPVEEAATDPENVEGWAVLAEKDDFSDVGFSDMLVDYIDIELLKGILLDAGWDPTHIHEAREFDRDSLQAELDWLENVADENDVVFLFVTGHSGYLRKILLWEEFFPQEWAEIQSERRILLVDMCLGARFTEIVNNDPNPHLSIASTDVNELGWKALKNEDLSFIGAIFNHFFVEAFSIPEADLDGDGRISVQEAVIYGEEKQREMMHNEVFSVPEFLEGYHSLELYPDQDPDFPHVVVDDTIGEPVFLNLDYYQ